MDDHTGISFQSQGIPCIHAIWELHRRNLPLQMHHFKQQWWLNPLINQQVDQRLLIQDPAIIRTRGRPARAKNKLKNDTKRDPSLFKYTERVIGGRNRRGGNRGGGKRGGQRGGTRGRGAVVGKRG